MPLLGLEGSVAPFLKQECMQTGKYRKRAQKRPLPGGLSPGVERENEASKLKHVYGLPYYIMCLVPAFTVTSLEFVQH